MKTNACDVFTAIYWNMLLKALIPKNVKRYEFEFQAMLDKNGDLQN